MIEVNSIYVNYGKSKVITDVSFSIKEKEKVVIMGRNGVGKTTLLKSLIGLLFPVEGIIKFNNENITNLQPSQHSLKGISYVPQGREIIPFFTVEENLELGALSHKVEYKKKKEQILEYFPALKEHLSRKGGVLSGGQQQQLAIGRALMSMPKLILLDEPSEGIQPNIVFEIANILNKIHKELGLTIIIVEQNLNFAFKVADKFLMMQKGQIVHKGKTSNLTTEVAKQYLSV